MPEREHMELPAEVGISLRQLALNEKVAENTALRAGQSLRVIGLDPGSIKMGFGILQECPGRAPSTLEAGVLAAKAGQPLAQRLFSLFGQLDEIFRKYEPTEMALENVFVGRNVKSAFILGHARAAAMLAAAQRGITVYEYAPSRVKKALSGSGRADKEQVRRMICRLLGLDLGNAPMDVSDALSLALCHLHSRPLLLKGLL